MKKIFLIAIVLFVGSKLWSQQPFELGATKHDSIYLNETMSWIKGVGRDTITASDSNKIVTERQMAAYVRNNSASAAGTAALQDSLDAHTDSLQSHNTRILANKALIASNQDSISIHMDTLKAHKGLITTNTDSITAHNTRINSNVSLIANLLDSIDVHTDSIAALRVDVNDIINNGAGGRISVGFSALLTDSILVAGDSTKYILTVTTSGGYANKSLVSFTITTENESAGTAVPIVQLYRLRSGMRVQMTSTGANFTTGATINPSYDDLQVGDKIMMKCTSVGAGTSTSWVRGEAIFQ
jgi:hypothetical protein